MRPAGQSDTRPSVRKRARGSSLIELYEAQVPGEAAPNSYQATAPMTQHPSKTSSGFTLVEILLAASLSAVLTIAMASAAGVFAEAVAEIEATSSNELDLALARIARDVRYAWWVDVPSSTRIHVTDFSNAETRYFLDGGDLNIQSPDGDIGTLASDIASLEFTSATTRRLREGSLLLTPGATLYSAPVGGAVDDVVILHQDEQVALGFYLPQSLGPAGVTDVDEYLVSASIETISLYVAGNSNNDNDDGELSVALYPSRGPGDAAIQLNGTALASATFAVAGLPAAGTISLSSLYVPDSFSSVTLEPGIGYTLVLTAVGSDTVVTIGTSPQAAPGAANGSVARRASFADNFIIVGTAAPFVLHGPRQTTTTLEQDVVSQITTAVLTASGENRVISMAVLSQTLVEDPWLGVVSGEGAPVP